MISKYILVKFSASIMFYCFSDLLNRNGLFSLLHTPCEWCNSKDKV